MNARSAQGSRGVLTWGWSTTLLVSAARDSRDVQSDDGHEKLP